MGLIDTHELDEDGWHDAEDCELCLETHGTVKCACQCGHCGERLMIAASFRDAEREPRIKEECKTLRELDEPIGYYLTDLANNYACHFFDRETRRCTIYETRPAICRIFNGDEERQGEKPCFLVGSPHLLAQPKHIDGLTVRCSNRGCHFCLFVGSNFESL